jgi:hypothetical protein
MARRGRVLIGTGLAVAAVVTGCAAVWIGSTRWARDTAAAEHALTATAAREAGPVSLGDLSGVPAPVQAYLRRTLTDGQPRVMAVRLQQSGRLRTGVESEQWLPFEATETLAPEAPGFVWHARVRVAPLLHVRVRDAYVQGAGTTQVAFQSAVTVSSQQGGRELNLGDLFRLLAEAPWCPTLLLPREGLQWAAIDGRKARASLSAGGETATVEFRFNDANEIAGIYAAERPRSYGTTYVATPWEGHFSEYTTVDGVRLPMHGEVGWWVDGRWMRVWEGAVTHASVEFRAGAHADTGE